MNAHKTEVNAAEGSTVDLHCIVRSSPAARVHWTRMDKPVKSGEKHSMHMHPHEKHHHNMSTLRIRDVNKDDLGQYECQAENSYGENKIAVSLIYEPEVPIINNCMLTDDLHTVQCNWTVISSQPLSEALLFYKQNGERKWQQVSTPSSIKKVEDNKWE